MSVRAYRITKMEWDNNPSFNLWHDDFIMENLSYTAYYSESNEISTIYIDQQYVEEMLEEFEESWKNYDGKDKTKENKKYYKEALERMLEDCKESGYAEYICY